MSENIKAGQVWQMFYEDQTPYDIIIHAVFRDLRGKLKVVYQHTPYQNCFSPRLVSAGYVTSEGKLKGSIYEATYTYRGTK